MIVASLASILSLLDALMLVHFESSLCLATTGRAAGGAARAESHSKTNAIVNLN